MGLNINQTTNIDTVVYNGVNIDTIIYNGVTAWTKSSTLSWKSYASFLGMAGSGLFVFEENTRSDALIITDLKNFSKAVSSSYFKKAIHVPDGFYMSETYDGNANAANINQWQVKHFSISNNTVSYKIIYPFATDNLNSDFFNNYINDRYGSLYQDINVNCLYLELYSYNYISNLIVIKASLDLDFKDDQNTIETRRDVWFVECALDFSNYDMCATNIYPKQICAEESATEFDDDYNYSSDNIWIDTDNYYNPYTKQIYSLQHIESNDGSDDFYSFFQENTSGSNTALKWTGYTSEEIYHYGFIRNTEFSIINTDINVCSPYISSNGKITLYVYSKEKIVESTIQLQTNCKSAKISYNGDMYIIDNTNKTIQKLKFDKNTFKITL